MKEIKLTQGKVALVDDEDFEYLSQWKWYALKQANNWYALRYGKKCNNIRMHRQLMGVTDPKMCVDHKDHNGLNNQRSNLRVCSTHQNAGNARKFNRVSGIKSRGVHLNSCGNFTVQIFQAGVKHYLGTYKTEREAAIVYNNKAMELFGEFANLNEVE